MITENKQQQQETRENIQRQGAEVKMRILKWKRTIKQKQMSLKVIIMKERVR